MIQVYKQSTVGSLGKVPSILNVITKKQRKLTNDSTYIFEVTISLEMILDIEKQVPHTRNIKVMLENVNNLVVLISPWPTKFSE